jgi:DNA-binding NtrC family response regulator
VTFLLVFFWQKSVSSLLSRFSYFTKKHDPMSYNIILLDTDAQHAQSIKDHLKAYAEYKIHVFTSFALCLEQLNVLKPAVIFLDAELKHDAKTIDTDKAFMAQLKERCPAAEIILYSGEEKLELMSDHVKDGAHGFIFKSTHTHIKAELLLLSAIRKYKLNKELKFYKVLSIAITIALVAALIFAVVAYQLHIVTDEIQGPFDE